MTNPSDPNDTVAICGDTSSFADDVAGTCRCGRVIYCRPHTAALVPPAQRLCAGCALEILQQSPDDVDLCITEETAAEIALWDAETKGKH